MKKKLESKLESMIVTELKEIDRRKWDLHGKNFEWKLALTYKQKKIALKWGKGKQSGRVDNWMKVIFIDELRICIKQFDDAGTFVWCRSNETSDNDCQKKICNHMLVLVLDYHMRFWLVNLSTYSVTTLSWKNPLMRDSRIYSELSSDGWSGLLEQATCMFATQRQEKTIR